MSQLSTQLRATGRVGKNAAARNALAESLAAKCADMTKNMSSKTDKQPKQKKDKKAQHR